MAVGFSVNDEIKEQQQKLVGTSPKEKLDYFLDYYKFHTIGVLLALILVTFFIRDIMAQKDSAMYAIYINGFPNVESEEFMEGFSEYIGINTDKEETILEDNFYLSEEDTSEYTMANVQKLVALAAAGSLDVIVADEYYFNQYGAQGFFHDLRDVLSQEQIAQYEDLFVYIDIDDDDSDEAIPIGICVTDASKIVSTESFPNADCYFSVVASSTHIENAIAYLDYLHME
ncbi:MAG: hypothetical protein R3Y24_08215 [Eubacteriales bacterium]